VQVRESEATGALGEFVIQAECMKCHSVFYALPRMWDMAKNIQQADEINKERMSLSGFDGGKA
jgi:hypothetical protein